MTGTLWVGTRSRLIGTQSVHSPTFRMRSSLPTTIFATGSTSSTNTVKSAEIFGASTRKGFVGP